MTANTEENKKAVASLVRARDNMQTVINRSEALEKALETLISQHEKMRGYVGEDCYVYYNGSKNVRVKDRILEQCNEARKLL